MGNQTPQVKNQRRHLVERRFGDADDIDRPLGVLNGLADPSDLAAQYFGGDQTGWIIRTAIDLQAGAEPFEANVQVILVVDQAVGCCDGGDIGVDTHGILRDARAGCGRLRRPERDRAFRSWDAMSQPMIPPASK